jgi:hypothetical protein
MLVSRKIKAKNPRAYHRPANFLDEEDFLRKEKNDLLVTLTQYIGKTKTKAETLTSLTSIETSVARTCKHSLTNEPTTLCSTCENN